MSVLARLLAIVVLIAAPFAAQADNGYYPLKADDGTTIANHRVPVEIESQIGMTPGTIVVGNQTGDVTLVNVFASWCIPCKAEHPVITRLSREQGVTVYGINYKDKPEDALTWLSRNGNPYAAIGADQDGRVSIDWGVYGVPESYLIDRKGRIRYKHVGPLTPQVVVEQILPMVKHLRQG